MGVLVAVTALALVFVPFWLIAGVGVRKDIREVHAITRRIEQQQSQSYQLGIYRQLTREDYESLGIGPEALEATVGTAGCAELLTRWYHRGPQAG